MTKGGLRSSDLARLEAFRGVAREVRGASIIEQGLSIKVGFLQRRDGVPVPDDVSGMLPDEQFRSLCVSLRLAYQPRQEAHFFSICGILKKAATPEQWERVKQLHAAWGESTRDPLGFEMIVDGDRYTSPDLFELWLNGVAFHQDQEKREAFTRLDELGAFAMLGVQITALRLADRIKDLDDIVAEITEQQPLPRINPQPPSRVARQKPHRWFETARAIWRTFAGWLLRRR